MHCFYNFLKKYFLQIFENFPYDAGHNLEPLEIFFCVRHQGNLYKAMGNKTIFYYISIVIFSVFFSLFLVWQTDEEGDSQNRLT